MRILFAISFCLLLTITIGFAQDPVIYKDTTYSIEERARDLVGRMNLEEKVLQMMNSSPGIDRLGIPPYDWWNEALHGVARSGVATVFPQAIGLGATFDPDLIYRVASAISDEARAMYNASSSKGYHKRYSGLTFWSPNVNIFRDPRWGRGQETYGEDPYLTSKLGVAFVKGLQGNHSKYLKTAACAKHFAVHSGPERLRHEFNAVSSDKDLYETYLPAFEALVKEGNVESVMCAYNRTNDEPCCASNFLLNEVLIKNWGFKGHIVSDCWAVVDFFSESGHGTVTSVEEASALAVKSGVNLNCGDEYPALVKAVEMGLIDEATIDASLARLMETRFKLGMFDPQAANPYSNIPTSVINSDAHRSLAREAAVKSIVLLKNNGVLPLRNDLARYYITGPNAGNVGSLIGNYYGVNPDLVTVLEGIAAAVAPGSQVNYRQGVLLDRPNVNPIDWASGVAHTSEATFMVMGINGLLEGEEGAAIASKHYGDLPDYTFPQGQIEYLKKLKNNNENPVIAIVAGGSPIDLSQVHEIADAVLMMWYPGQEGGNAVADIIFGKTSPSGRLPITFPKSLDQLPPYDDYSMVGRTYKYMEQEPMYPFGFGLSYGKIEYADLKLSEESIKRKDQAELSVTVTNTGEHSTEEVVQLYVTATNTDFLTPLYSLKGIRRINLSPGQSQTLKFPITPGMLQMINDQGESVLAKGAYGLSVGGSLPGNRSVALGGSGGLQATLTVR